MGICGRCRVEGSASPVGLCSSQGTHVTGVRVWMVAPPLRLVGPRIFVGHRARFAQEATMYFVLSSSSPMAVECLNSPELLEDLFSFASSAPTVSLADAGSSLGRCVLTVACNDCQLAGHPFESQDSWPQGLEPICKYYKIIAEQAMQ